jgi:hypothetical protein
LRTSTSGAVRASPELSAIDERPPPIAGGRQRPYFAARQIIDPGCAVAVHEVEALIGGHENRSRADHAHCRLLSIPSIPPTSALGDGRRRHRSTRAYRVVVVVIRAHHSITLSARTRIDCGSVIPSALAVFMFTASSNSVGSSTGRSAGLAPLRILSMKYAQPPEGSGQIGTVAHEVASAR